MGIVNKLTIIILMINEGIKNSKVVIRKYYPGIQIGTQTRQENGYKQIY